MDKNQSSKFCQAGVKQTHFQNLKEKRKWFFLSQGHLRFDEFVLKEYITVIITINSVFDTNVCPIARGASEIYPWASKTTLRLARSDNQNFSSANIFRNDLIGNEESD